MLCSIDLDDNADDNDDDNDDDDDDDYDDDSDDKQVSDASTSQSLGAYAKTRRLVYLSTPNPMITQRESPCKLPSHIK